MNQNNQTKLILLSIGMLLGAFLPWVDVPFLGDVTPWEIMFHEEARRLPAYRFIFLAFPLTGLVILLKQMKTGSQIDIANDVLYKVPICTFGIMLLGILVESEGKAFRGLDDPGDLFKVFDIGFWMTFISSIILAFEDAAEHRALPKDRGVHTAEHFASQPISQIQSIPVSPPVAREPIFRLPNVDWSGAWNVTRTFLLKYKIHLGVALLLAGIMAVVYHVFIKADPVADGKEMAAMVCACHEDDVQRRTDSLTAFVARLHDGQFDRRQDARDALDLTLSRCDQERAHCQSEADQAYNSRYVEYAASGGEVAGIFRDTYQPLSGSCDPDHGQEREAQTEIDRLIAKIQDPLPDVVQLKKDLVGQQVTAIGVIALSDLTDKGMEILSQEQVGDHIEYLVELTLGSDAYAETRHCKMKMSYNLGDYGWQLTSSTWEEIGFTYRLYPDRYIEFPRVSGLNMTYPLDHKISWRFSDWWSTTYLTTGPNEPRVEIPTRDKYALMSLEDREVLVMFRYLAG